MNVDIRPVTTDDAVQIAGLLIELGYPLDATQVESRLHAAMNDRHFVLVADTGSSLIGVLSAAVVPLLGEASTTQAGSGCSHEKRIVLSPVA